MSPTTLAAAVKEQAAAIGLPLCGITGPEPMVRMRQLLAARRARGRQSPFADFAPDIRCVPEQSLKRVQSIIVVGMPYQEHLFVREGILARFARGRDYHLELKDALARMHAFLSRLAGREVAAMAMVDTGPLVERAFARRAGLGWWGKNCCLVNPQQGSFFALGELLVDIYLERDAAILPACGNCRRCVEACPTGALAAPYRLDYSRCLSYWTQARGFLPRQVRPLVGQRLYGCDTCQECCPYNHPKASPEPSPVTGVQLKTILDAGNKDFRRRWQETALGWRGNTILKRNALVVAGNSGAKSWIPEIIPFLADHRPELRGHAAWSLGRLGGKEALAALQAAAAKEKGPAVAEELRQALGAIQA